MSLRIRFAWLIVTCATASVTYGQPPSARLITPSQRYALTAPAPRYTLEAEGVDRVQALAADIGTPKSAPLRYALSREIHNAAFSQGKSLAGEWRDLADGMALWRLPVHATGALTLDFGFRHFFLPPGAQLFIGNANRQLGPYGDGDNPRSGEFWTPLLYGDDALIEVLLPQAMKPFLQIDLGTVHVGYRDIFRPKAFSDPGVGSGSCNVDTICPQGDPWRSQINAEAVVVLNGGFCSGQLLNDVRNDHVPYLSTANHCISTQSDATSLIVYWKYESPVCRGIGSADSGAPVPTDQAIAQTGGAQLLATYEPADFTLVQLNTPPPAAAKVYWNGWDRSDDAFSGAVVLHHPSSDAKRISFAAGLVTLEDDAGSADVPGQHHWLVDHYDLGTTEEGSSGSGLIDANHHLRGVLSGGAALCSDPAGNDYYGRLSSAWEGGGDQSSRLRDWLDPDASGLSSHDGIGACVAPTVNLNTSANPLIAGQRVTISAYASGGAPPYTYAFDVDGDGMADNQDAQASSLIAAYPGAFSGNVGVTVTDSSGCVGAASRALIVQAQNAGPFGTCFFSSCPPGLPPSPIDVEWTCGADGPSDSDPTGSARGAHVLLHLNLRNSGTAPTSNAYAVFAQNLSQPGQAKITLENPAVTVPTLAPNDEANVALAFDVAADAQCNAPFEIDFVGTADDNSFASNPMPLYTGSVRCQPALCPAQITPIVPKRGNFFDPHRAGSGMTQFTASVPGIDPVFFGAWFTGDSARHPTWYIVNDALHANQVNTTLYQTHLSAPDQFPETATAVGNAQVSLISATKFAYTWVLNGVAGGAIYVPVVADPHSSLRSWFNTGQNGWGTFDELFPSGGSQFHPYMFNLVFLYDNAGMPRWTTGADATYVDGHVLTEMVARPSCPSCVWLDYSVGAQVVGPLSYRFSGGRPFISTNLSFPAAYPGTWIRNSLPLTPLLTPQ